MSIIDPPPAPEGSNNIRPSDLLNKPCLIRPTGTGVWGPESKTPNKPYIIADCWSLDRAGIVDYAEGLWIGWWRAVAQLKDCMGEMVACRPTQQADNSIELVPLTGEARQVAAKAADTLTAAPPVPEAVTPPAYAPDEEPFS